MHWVLPLSVLFHKSQRYNFQLWCVSLGYHVLWTNMDVSPFITSTDQNGDSLTVSVLAMVLSCQSLDGAHLTKRRRNHYTYWFLFKMSCFNYQPSFRNFFFSRGASTRFSVLWSLFFLGVILRCYGLPSWGFAIKFIGHTTVCRSSLDEWTTRRIDRYLTTYKSQRTRISVSPERLEPAIPAGEQRKIHALDRSATGIGHLVCTLRGFLNYLLEKSCDSA